MTTEQEQIDIIFNETNEADLETSINETEIPNLGEVKTLYPSYGIVEDDLCNQYDDINDLISGVKSEMPFVPHHILE
jgi:hypothetical protein